MTLVLQGAGTSADAGTWEKVGVAQTIKIVTPTLTVNAVRLTVRELQYAVVFSFTVSQSVYNELGWQTLASEYASIVQTLGSYEGTQGLQYVEDVNGSNQLEDFIIVTVGDPDLVATVDVKLPLATATNAANSAKMIAAYTAVIANLAAV